MRHTIWFHCLAGALALAWGCKSATDVPELTPINTTSSARFVAGDIVAAASGVRAGLANGTYTSVSRSGTAGSAIVSGTISHQSGISCGTSCVRSETNTTLTIVFTGYGANTASNTTTTLSGTITYRDTRYSQQTGSGYTSGGSLCVTATTVLQYRMTGTDAAGTFGLSDTIMAFSACGSETSQSGSLTTSSGSFSF